MDGTDRVRRATADPINRRLDQERVERVAELVGSSPEELGRAIDDLDRIWDVERVLEANASTLMLVSLGLARVHSPKWLLLSTAVPAFLLQHAIQGWCPPLPLFRRLGYRTQREIDEERYALKALRGDFNDLADRQNLPAAEGVLEAVES